MCFIKTHGVKYKAYSIWLMIIFKNKMKKQSTKKKNLKNILSYKTCFTCLKIKCVSFTSVYCTTHALEQCCSELSCASHMAVIHAHCSSALLARSMKVRLLSFGVIVQPNVPSSPSSISTFAPTRLMAFSAD